MSCCGNNANNRRPSTGGLPDGCCTGTTGCAPLGNNLNNVKIEPIYVQKVYDSALFKLQQLVSGTQVALTATPAIPAGATISEVVAVRCRKFFDPDTPNDNLTINPTTVLSGADFIGDPVIGPDGLPSQRLVYVDTERCDEECLGTSIYGTQEIAITGNVEVEIDVRIREACGRRCRVTLRGLINVSPNAAALILNNFFELCVPSTSCGAFLPRFTEFCNVHCETRPATGSVTRDFTIQPDGTVIANLITALCVSCEKKIIVPVQLCVLSTGFPNLEAVEETICRDYPSLFPNQIDEDSVRENRRANRNSNYKGLNLTDDEDNLDDFEDL